MASLKHDYARLLNLARVKLPGSSDAVIKAELFETLHEFTFETNVWWEDIPITTVIGITTYTLLSDEPGEIVRLISLRDANLNSWAASMPTPPIVTLSQLPQQVSTIQALTARVARVPGSAVSRDSETGSLPDIPEELLPLYGPNILDGVLGRCMAHINKPYSNERMALYHLRRFRSSLTATRAAVLKQNTYGTNSWGYPQGFRSTGQKGGVTGFSWGWGL